MNYYPFHIGDYASATRHLSWDEDLAYRRLIDAYYTKEAPIPADKRAAYRLVCATTEAQREAVDVVLQEFFVLTGDVWVHDRCEAEIHAAVEKRAKASQSAKARWSNASAKRTESDGNADAMRTHKETDANAYETPCEGNAPNPNPNISIPDGIDNAGATRTRFDAQAHLVGLGVDSGVASDWLAHRKAKRAKPTLTAINGIVSEAAKAGISLSDALSISCQRGWTGFEASWVARDQPRQPVATIHDQRAATIAALTGRTTNERANEPRDITAEAVRVA